MKIMLKLPDGGFDEREIEEGAYIEDVYKSVKDSLAYPCIAAKVDNEYQDLRTRLWSECRVELLDMRSKGACRESIRRASPWCSSVRRGRCSETCFARYPTH